MFQNLDQVIMVTLLGLAIVGGVNLVLWLINYFCSMEVRENFDTGHSEAWKPIPGKVFSKITVLGLILVVIAVLWTGYPHKKNTDGEAWRAETAEVKPATREEVLEKNEEIRIDLEERDRVRSIKKQRELESDSDDLFKRLMGQEEEQRRSERDKEKTQ